MRKKTYSDKIFVLKEEREFKSSVIEIILKNCKKKMARKHLYGEAMDILKYDEENKPVIVEETLNYLFDHPEVKDR